MLPHPTSFPHTPDENTLPEHVHSPPESSNHDVSAASPAADQDLSDDSRGSAGPSPVSSDKPFWPSGPHSPVTLLEYTVAPDRTPEPNTPDHRRSPFPHSRNDDSYSNPYAPRYRQTGDGRYSAPDPPFVPPDYYPPPPLVLQRQRQAMYQHTEEFDAPAPHRDIQTLPTIVQPQRDPRRSLSSSSDISDLSLAHSHARTPASIPPPSPPVPVSRPDSRGLVKSGSAPAQPLEALRENDGDRSNSEPLSGGSQGSDHSQHWIETDKYLRNQIGIPEGTPVNLWALPDPPSGQKPQQPLPILVKLAIHGSKKGMLTLQEIYQALEDRFEYFARLQSSAWKNSIRHNLSLNQVFRSCDRPITEPGKGRYWSLDISKGEGYKRERRRKRRNAAPYNGTRDLPGGLGNQPNLKADSSDSETGGDNGDAAGVGKAGKAKKGRKRGPYTRITVPQPSVPGTTGITCGGAAAAALVSSQASGENVSLTSTGGMAYNTAASSSTAPTRTTSPLVPPASHLQQSRQRDAARLPSTAPVTLPYPIPYHGMYFNRARDPMLGQSSISSPGSFGSSNFQTRERYSVVGNRDRGAGVGIRGRLTGADGDAISVSSDSSAEENERMTGIRGAGDDDVNMSE